MLNKERALKEAVGDIKWLRPDYQIPRLGDDAEMARLEAERKAQRDAQKLRPAQGSLGIEDDLREMMPAGVIPRSHASRPATSLPRPRPSWAFSPPPPAP
jgi:hypothetical protein